MSRFRDGCGLAQGVQFVVHIIGVAHVADCGCARIVPGEQTVLILAQYVHRILTMTTSKHWLIGATLFIGVMCALPEETAAQYHGVTHHRVSRRATRVQRPGWNHGHGQQSVPELDPTAAGAALALLLGGAAVLGSARQSVPSVREA